MKRPRHAVGKSARDARTVPVVVIVVSLVSALCCIAITSVARSETSARHLVAAASDEHFWFVADAFRLNNRQLLCHHAVDMAGPFASSTVTLSRRPATMAAFGPRVWLVFPERDISGDIRREVFTLRIEYDDGMEMYRPRPRDRLRVVDTLPGHGRLAGLVGTADGPAALIVPTRPLDLPPRPGSIIPDPHFNGDEEAGALPGRENEAGEVAESREALDVTLRSRLLLLESERWIDLELPDEFVPDQRSRVGVSGPGRERLHLLTPDPDDRFRTNHFVRGANGEWSRHTLNLDLTTVQGLTTVAGRLVAVLRDDAGGPDETMPLVYVRPDRLIEFSRFEPPTGEWTVLGMRDGLRLLDATTRDEVGMQLIDPITGAIGQREIVRDQPLPAARLWHMTLMLTLAVTAVILVLVVRPASQEQIKVPGDRSPAPFSMRAMALAIDLIPGAVAAVLLLRAPPSELLRLPILMGTLDDALPHLVMLGLTLVHGTATELMAGTTLGKAILGLRVTNAGGQRAAASQILLRNLLKGLIFLIPPLAIFMVLNHYMQGVNDLVARTLILRPKPPNATESPGEQSDS